MSRQPLSRSLSLKARAIALLAQRDHSSIELRRKLVRIARERDAKASAAFAAEATTAEAHAGALASQELEAVDPGEEVDALLAWLRAQGYLNESRFVESRIHARASRHGNLRIRQELAQHGLTPDAEQLEKLKDSELDRARAIWQRKFGAAAQQTLQEPAERARQMRFLGSRGFSADVIRRVLRDPSGEDD